MQVLASISIIYIGSDGRMTEAHRFPQLRTIENLHVGMSEHCPEPSNRIVGHLIDNKIQRLVMEN